MFDDVVQSTLESHVVICFLAMPLISVSGNTVHSCNYQLNNDYLV